jgi:hypothetical protein
MPTYKKIPASVKAEGCVASLDFAIFCKGLLTASEIIGRLYKADKKRSIPIVGYVIFKKKRVFYCRIGFVDDPDIYR